MAKSSEKTRDPYDGLRPWSAITHGIGILLSLLAALRLIPKAASSPMEGALPAVTIYVVSMISLYTASTLYHSLRTGVKGRIILRKIDHLMIYYLIAGTYTPFCVLSLHGTFGTVLLAVIWSLALIGSAVNLVWIHLPRWLTSAIYLVMGWISVVAIYPLSKTLGPGLFWLVLGGVLYTVGGVLYAVKWPGRDNPRFGCHEIFHVFILLGSMCHYMTVVYTLSG